MVPQWLIEKKRDGGTLDADEIRALIKGFTDGTIPDYQMSAFAMAVFFRGMTAEETAVLTEAMLCSGERVTFGQGPRPTADKHSTGGIGDKISLMLAPLAASAGLAVPMIAGRGLGITGGTIDKLEAIPGYDTALSIEAFKRVVGAVGCSITGQTDRLAPADKKFYALRDVTGTVPSLPLITASVMSKKLAEGADTLVFDVKCGGAAFMGTHDQARALAQSLIRVGRAFDRKTGALITDMHQPLGRAVGNAVEVAEAIETLKGGGPADTRLLTIELTALMCELAGVYTDRATARRELARRLDDGRALDVFRRLVTAQGGDARVIDEPRRLPQPGAAVDVRAPQSGTVARVNAEQIGRVVLQLGGGRTVTTDVIDAAAGIDRLVQAGEQVEKGQPLMRLLAKNAARIEPLLATAAAAVQLTQEPVPERRLILEEVATTIEDAQPPSTGVEHR